MRRFLLLAILAAATPVQADPQPATATVPQQPTPLFNGTDLKGLTTWLRDGKREDPKKVFSVKDGILHISGEGFGYVATEKAYRDYHLTVEYRWGKRTDGGKYVRNSGILIHATGPDGAANGTWMASIECQLAQGCVGDLIVIRGKDEKGEVIPVELTSDVVLGPDKKPRWKEGGEKRVFTSRQLWWNNHDPDFKELIDTRGKHDVESQLGDWTKVECICVGDKITVLVNGHKVNVCYDVKPSAGKILLQSEGFELDVCKFEIKPVSR
jgi:hypothetical protein